MSQGPFHPEERRPAGRSSHTPVVIPGAEAGVAGINLNTDLLYRTFLQGCRELPDKVMVQLQSWGATRSGAQKLGIRYYSREYSELLTGMEERFGLRALLGSGLIDSGPGPRSPQAGKPDELLPMPDQLTRQLGAFQPYHQANVPYLVIPFHNGGQVVYLKARPLLDPAKLRRLGLPAMLATAANPPCLYNVDMLAKAQRVILLHRELDVLVATALGLPALAAPNLQFKPAWVRAFAGKLVFLVVDAQQAADQRVEALLDAFTMANLPAPQIRRVPQGQDLCRYLRENLTMAVLAPEESSEDPSLLELAVRRLVDPLSLREDGRLIAAIPSGVRRWLCVHLIEQDDEESEQPALAVRCRYFAQKSGEQGWQADERLQLLLPQEKISEFVYALAAASCNEQVMPMPEPLVEHLKAAQKKTK